MLLSIIIPTLYQDMYYSDLMFNLRDLWYIKRKDVEIITIEDTLVNEAWNIGVKKATGNYILILNDDIIIREWCIESMIWMLNYHKIACPYYSRGDDEEKIYASNGKNIVWFCFMMKKETIDECFPIPDDLKLWYGDNWIYNKLQWDIWRWGHIHHWESKSLTAPERKEQIDKIIEWDKYAWNSFYKLIS